ncbi:hypothetical protein EI94DRAFT_908180 [Lactarius quietus]|nr:hypothetical protein EI94DRAFT_908180 [Lactarius quietus]
MSFFHVLQTNVLCTGICARSSPLPTPLSLPSLIFSMVSHDCDLTFSRAAEVLSESSEEYPCPLPLSYEDYLSFRFAFANISAQLSKPPGFWLFDHSIAAMSTVALAAAPQAMTSLRDVVARKLGLPPRACAVCLIRWYSSYRRPDKKNLKL